MDASPPVTPPRAASRRFGVFGHKAFATIWVANLAALTGVAMYDTVSGWMILKFGPDPAWVSMLRVAIDLPIFLVTLLAGAASDIFDPRRILIGASVAVAGLTAIFALLATYDLVNSAMLLANTFLISTALSVAAPAWLAIAPQLVAPEELPGAMAANGISFNLSRAIGPALGGLAINALGVSAPLAFLIAGNLAVWAALSRWRPPTPPSTGLPTERLTSAMRIGLRHAFNNRPFLVTIGRTAAIYPFAAAYWGLLPLVAARIEKGAGFYGNLLSVISIGSILGSIAHRWLRARFGFDEIVAFGSLATGLALAGFAFAHAEWAVILASLVAGAGWLMVLSSLYAAAERTLAAWVRARGLSVFLTVVFAAMTLGSAFWGYVARWQGLDFALSVAAAGAIAGVPLSWRWRMNAAALVDLTPSGHWRMPETAGEIENGRGPVLVKIRYQIDPTKRVEFLRAMDELGFERRSDGAFGWGIFEDATATGRYEEAYLIESWLELMHLRERVTHADRQLENEIREFLVAAPEIEFLVFAQPRRGLFAPRTAASEG